MKVTNGDIFGAAPNIAELLKVEFPVKTSWMLVKLASKLNIYFQDIEKIRSAMVLRHGEIEESTGQTVIKPNSLNWDKFVDEYNELMTQEENIDLEKILIPTELNGKPISVRPNILFALEKFIEV